MRPAWRHSKAEALQLLEGCGVEQVTMDIYKHFRGGSVGRYVGVAMSGALFSLIPWTIMTMDFRYGLAVTGGILALVLAMICIYRLVDFLIYGLIFHIPFSLFGKWLFVQEVLVPVKGINVGLVELLLLLAYLVWFAQIFIVRSAPLPRLEKIDLFVCALFLIHIISLTMAPNKVLGMFDVIYTVKHMLMYFFLSRKVQRRHLKWIIILFLFAIVFETCLAFFERLTGYVSIGLNKGNINSADFGSQYAVPGIENELRAAGTTNDSHSLGLYYAMLLPLPFVIMASEGMRLRTRIVHGITLIFGVMGLIITFSRSGWLGFAVAAFVASMVIIFVWKQGRIIGIMLFIILGVSCLYPKSYSFIYKRVFEAPKAIMESRFEMNYTALDIWRTNFLFGCGPGNYVDAMKQRGVRSQHANVIADLPVHNIFLYTVAEIGLLGFVAFFGLIFMAMRKCWQCLRLNKDYYLGGLALGVFCGLIGYLVDGLFDPMFRESVPYAQLWTFLALSASFVRLKREKYPVFSSQTQK